MKCQKCQLLSGKHLYQESLFCCACFDELVSETFQQIIKDADRIMELFEETQSRLEKSEIDQKLMQEAYDRLIEEFKQWVGKKAIFERLKEKSSREKN